MDLKSDNQLRLLRKLEKNACIKRRKKYVSRWYQVFERIERYISLGK